jgi:LacI family transcriptional regulator
MITIKDVAREAGVSVATVSRVYTGADRVSEPTRLRVREVGRRLGYSPHGAARSLITRKTSTLGVLLPDLYGEFFSEVIRGIDQAARHAGYHLLVSSAHEDSETFEAALRSMRGRVDGLIVMSPGLDAGAALASLPASFPIVLLNSAAHGDRLDSIGFANYEGALAMVRYLVGLGHRRIAIITGADGNFDAAERVRGYRAALAEAGITPDPAWVIPGDFSESSGYAAALTLLELTPRPGAVFATNDSMAIGALSRLREAGLEIPRDMAVAGFDDIPMARYMNPPLTSVHVDISALGELATRRLLAGIERHDPGRERHVTLPATLMIRESCAGPSAGRATPIRRGR